MAEEELDDVGAGIELALRGDTIRKRHIATRASNRRRIVVLVEGDVEFEGYSIGIDGHSLQLLELPSGEVSSISLDHIMAITDGKLFVELTKEEKDLVDQRTASFRRTSQIWLVKNWPKTYDHRGLENVSEDLLTPTRPKYKRPYPKPAGYQPGYKNDNPADLDGKHRVD